VLYVEQRLLTLKEHLSSSQLFRGICGARSFVFCVHSVLFTIVCPFVLFRLVIVLSVFLRFTDFSLPLWYLLITPLVSSDYPFGIFWLPLWYLLITPLVSSDYTFGIFKLFIIYIYVNILNPIFIHKLSIFIYLHSFVLVFN
jgi:hypothetical protein